MMRKFNVVVGIQTFDVDDMGHQSLKIKEVGRHLTGCVKPDWNVAGWDDEKIENWVEAYVTQGRFDEVIKVNVVRNYLVKIQLPNHYVEVETNDDCFQQDMIDWIRGDR